MTSEGPKGFYVTTRLGANYFLVTRGLLNGRISRSGDFSKIYRVSSSKFLLPKLNFDYIDLDKINLLLIPSLGQPCRPELKVTGF